MYIVFADVKENAYCISNEKIDLKRTISVNYNFPQINYKDKISMDR